MNSSDQDTVIVGGPPAEEPSLWPIGGEIEDRYHVLEIRGGRGISGMGVVYILEDDGRCLAAKTFQRRFAQRLDFIQRFIREAQTWILLGNHPNIVRAHHFDIIDAMPYLFMEFVPGDGLGRHSVADALRRAPLSLAQTLDMGIQVCDGMIHATGAAPELVHRDLKPENLLLSPDGIVKITDFGLVRCRAAGELLLRTGTLDANLDYAGLTQAGTVFGTPAYMAPEQFQDPAAVSGAADIYALGCCLYEMLIGVPPFLVTAQTTVERLLAFRRKHEMQIPPLLRDVLPDCPRELDNIVNRCLEKEPERRWSHFAEIRERLVWLAEHVLGIEVRDVPTFDSTAQEIAEQTRSLVLIEGYDRAIRLRNLRENQESSPYAFHLALASYFHVQRDPHEERRQLDKALRSRGTHAAGEAVRRLGDLLVSQGALREADTRLGTFLKENPHSLDLVLEPYVRLRIAQRRFDEAEQLIAGLGDEFRARVLRVELLKAQERHAELLSLLESMAGEELRRIEEKTAGLSPDKCVGWERHEDPDVLIDVLTTLRPALDTALLQVTDQVFWPDITGDPDFSDSLAWLSFLLGELAQFEATALGPSASELDRLAVLLGYPERLPRYLERDESWFWCQDESTGPEGQRDV